MGKQNKKSLDKIFLYLLLGSIVVYFSQGSLYPNGSIISKSALVLWLLIDICYFFVYISKYRLLSFERLIFIFWFVNTCYWFFPPKVQISDWGEPLSTSNNFKSICWTFLTYYPIRYFTKKELITDKVLSFFAILMFLVFVMSFFSFRARLLYEYNRDAITNNMGYRFVSLLPLLGIFRRPKYTFAFIGISIYFIIMSSKRGAILCGIFAFIFLFIYSLRGVPRKKKLQYSILVLGVCGLFVYLLYDVFLSNEYLMQRLSNMEAGNDDSGNARINQINAIWEYVTNGSMFYLLFGYGFDKSVMMAGNYAHNDWAELLANLGLLGCTMYFLFFIKLFNIYRSNRKKLSSMQKYMFISVVGMWLLMSMFSMGYISNTSFLFMITIAYIVSDVEKKERLCLR